MKATIEVDQLKFHFRIERLWREVWVAVTCKYHDVLHSLEEDGLLDVSDVVHLFGVNYIFVPRLQANLDTFITGWDNRSLRSEGGLTPEQLWCMGHLQDLDEFIKEWFTRQSVWQADIDFVSGESLS